MTALAAVVYIITLVLVMLGFAVLVFSAWWEFGVRYGREQQLKTPPPPWPPNPGWVESSKDGEG